MQSQFDSQGTCPVCQGNLNADNARLLKCLHSVCNACVQLFIDKACVPDQRIAKIQCVKCKHVTEASQIISNPFIDEQAKVPETSCNEKDQSCTSCDERFQAQWYCFDCDEWLCDGCEQAHGRVKLTKKHMVKHCGEVESCLKNRKSILCKLHANQRLRYYCNLCGCLTCKECKETSHQDHQHRPIGDAADDFRKRLQTLMDECKACDNKQGEMFELIDSQLAKIAEIQGKVSSDIRSFTVKLMESVQKREKQLLKELKVYCNNKRKLLKFKLVQACAEYSFRNLSISFTQKAIKDPDPLLLLYVKDNINDRLGEIRQMQSTKLDDLKVQVQFASDQGNFDKSITMLGMLLVDGYPHGSSAECIPACKAKDSTRSDLRNRISSYKSSQSTDLYSPFTHGLCSTNYIGAASPARVCVPSTDPCRSPAANLHCAHRTHTTINPVNGEGIQIGRPFLPLVNSNTISQVMSTSALLRPLKALSESTSKNYSKRQNSVVGMSQSSLKEPKAICRSTCQRRRLASPETYKSFLIDSDSETPAALTCCICRGEAKKLQNCSLCLRFFHSECLLHSPSKHNQRYKWVCSICLLMSTSSHNVNYGESRSKRRKIEDHMQICRCLWLEFFINLPNEDAKQLTSVQQAEPMSANGPSYKTIRMRLMDSSSNPYASTASFVKEMRLFLIGKINQCDYTSWFERLLKQHLIQVDSGTNSGHQPNQPEAQNGSTSSKIRTVII